jgi:steroid delta-isomerase-like uncharacterized protein
MTRDAVVAFFEQWETWWAGRDVDGLAGMHAENVKVTSPMFGQIKGRAAVAESYVRLFSAFPDWTLTTEDLIVDGDTVAQVFSATATHKGDFMGLPGSGRKAQFHGVRVLKFGDGLIQEERRLYDFTLLLMQVGVLRGKPGH